MRRRLMQTLLALGLAAIPAAGQPAGSGGGKAIGPLQPATEQVQPASAGEASGGSSALPPTGPNDAYLERKRAEDERRATESKEKMKKRPGYQENVPTPRA